MAKTLKAKEGKYLYNGTDFVKIITIANEKDENNWQEVTQEFYDEKHLQEQIQEAEVIEEK